MAETLVVYTHPGCGHSAALKHELAEQQVEYEEVNLELHPEEWTKVEELTGGERITPVSVEGDLVTMGYGGVG